DPPTHPPRRLSLDRRPAGRHQRLPRRAQCQSQTVRLDQIRRGHPGQARSSSCNISLSQCTSVVTVKPTEHKVVSLIISSRDEPSFASFVLRGGLRVLAVLAAAGSCRRIPRTKRLVLPSGRETKAH